MKALVLLEVRNHTAFSTHIHTCNSHNVCCNLYAVQQLIYLCDILLAVDNQQRNTQQYGAESLDGFLEFTLCRELVCNL